MSSSSDGRIVTEAAVSNTSGYCAQSELDHFQSVTQDLGFEFRIYAMSSGRKFLPSPWSILPDGLTPDIFNSTFGGAILDLAVRRRGLCDWNHLGATGAGITAEEALQHAASFEIGSGYSASFIGVGLRCDIVIVLSARQNELDGAQRLVLFEAMSRMWHAQHDAEWRQNAQLQKLPKLTQREMQVLVWIKEGKSYGDVATITGLSTRAIEFHAKNVLMKLEAANKLSAVLNAIKLGILPID